MDKPSIQDKIKEINLYAICDTLHNQIDQCFSSFLNQEIALLKSGSGYYKINLNQDDADYSKIEISKCKSNSNPKLDIVSLTYDNEMIYLVKSNGECHYVTCKGYESMTLLNSTLFAGNLTKKYIIKVSCGEQHAVFITHAGLVFVIGSGDKGELGLESQNIVNEPTMVNHLLNYRIIDVFCGKKHNVAIGLKRDSNLQSVSNDVKPTMVFVWGDNTYGQLGLSKMKTPSINIPTELTEFEFTQKDKDREIRCVNGGLYHSYILFNNNELYGFGDNEYKQIHNSSVVIIDKPTKINIELINQISFTIENIHTSCYSTLLLDSNDMKIILFGQISPDPCLLSLKEDPISMKHSFLLTDYCLYVFYSSPLSNVILYQMGLKISLQPISQRTNLNHSHTQSIIESSSSNDENDFNVLKIENDLLSERSNPDFGFSFEKSIEELRNYISLVGISLPTSQGQETLNASTMDFRPKNLPKKSKEEEVHHRYLVEENRKHYINSIKQKQEEEKKRKRKQDEKKKNNAKLVSIWQKEILVNWFTTKDEYKTKRLFYEGLPSNLRGKIWSLCIGNCFSITQDYYNIEVRKAVKLLIELDKNKSDGINKMEAQNNKYNVKVINRENSIKYIDLDIERTFPELGIFKSNSPLSSDLREILCAFVVSRPDIGYVQGISYIAAMLLINLEKFPSFVALINIILNANIIPFYRFDEASIRKRFQLFKQIFYENLPELCSHFEANDVFPDHYLIEWIMTLFSRSLNVDLVARIWDVYLIEGIKAVFQAGIVLLSIFEKKLLDMDFDEIMKALKTLNTQLIDEDEFIDLIQKVKIPEWISNELGRLNEENIPI